MFEAVDFEASIGKTNTVVIFIATHQDIGQTGFSNPCSAQNNDSGATKPFFIVYMDIISTSVLIISMASL